MFTAARLIAALCLAVLGYLGSNYVRGLLPEIQNFGIFNYVNTAVGFLCGWIIAGPRFGRGIANAISMGITAVAAMLLWAVFLQSVNEMVKLAMKHRYGGAMEAFAAVFEIGVEYGAILMDPGFLGMMAIGAVITGVVSEIAARNWR